MSTFNLPIDSITIDTINGFINNVSEGTQIEFKSQLNIARDEQKKEFLSDICSFATYQGGDIYYGINENNGTATELTPISIADIDASKRQINDIIRNNITPPISFLIKEFNINNNYIILIRIFKLFPGPPMVTFRGLTKFFSRGATNKFPMNYLQIKDAFLFNNTLNEKFRKFKEERINLYLNGSERNDPSNPFLIFWIYPLNEINIDFNRLSESDIRKLLPVYLGGQRTYNIDGLSIYNLSEGDEYKRFIKNQLFFNGIFESYNDGLLSGKQQSSGIIITPLHFIENYIYKTFEEIINFYNSKNILSILLFSFALINVQNTQGCLTNDSFSLIYFNRNFRSNLLFQDYIINMNDFNINFSMKPIFDELWRAYGKQETNTIDEHYSLKRNIGAN